MKKLPIGVQSIREILEEDQVYIDKTMFAKDLITTGKHYFISRPRRFGKSLFINTLEEIFKGNKELFKDCKIYESGYDWQKYPVLYLDFSKIASRTPDHLETALQVRLEIIAKEHDISIVTTDIQVALDTLVVRLSNKYRKKVAVLIDEYDKPIIDHLEDLDVARKNRDILKDFFGTIKSLDKHLKFTFITGISKFSRVSLFSALNNLNDITMEPKYAGMMGYTEEELRASFRDHIQKIAQERSQLGNLVPEEKVIDEVRNWYNGYRFSEGKLCVYNPFSTLKFMQSKKPKTYWYSTGTPSFLIHQLKEHLESMVSLDGTTATEEELMDISSLEQINLEALMYQTGYFTIKDYNSISNRYLLGLPNEEVRSAFINSLVKNFAPITKLRSSRECVEALEKHQPSLLFNQIEIGLSSFAYQVFVDAKERTYQAMLLSMLHGMGFNPLSERSINTGRIDVILEVPKTTYILELKLDGSADKALKQIHEKQYFKPYTHKGKHIVIIGANFSSEARNVSEWKGELLSESGEKIRELFPGEGE
ncbi:ATP-binding protein [Candidatus Neptunochlamydia vexilliferae]|nr:ATP-binding protein [Candidatus Neptunochlamydia vexilliferae]